MSPASSPPRHSPARNPFHYGTPAEGDHFTGRQEELAALLTRMRNGVNVVLLSPRRYGKTSLLRAAEARLTRARPPAAIIEVNVLRATSLSGLVGLLTAGAFHLSGARWQRARQAVPEFLRRVRVHPIVTFDPNGNPRFGFDAALTARDAETVLADVYGLLAEEAAKRPAALVLDEFQAITRHGDDLPDLFKALADAHPRVSLVLAGSKRHLMEELVIHNQAPLFGMAQRLTLGPIPAAEMEAYLRQRAAGAGKPLDDTAAAHLLALAGPVPNDIQHLAFEAFEAGQRPASTWPPSIGAWPGPSTTTACSSPRTWPASRPARAGSWPPWPRVRRHEPYSAGLRPVGRTGQRQLGPQGPPAPPAQRGRRRRGPSWSSPTPSSRPGCAVTELPELIVADVAAWRPGWRATTPIRPACGWCWPRKAPRPTSLTYAEALTKPSATAGSTAGPRRDEATYSSGSPPDPPQRLVETQRRHCRAADRRRPHAAGRAGRGGGGPADGRWAAAYPVRPPSRSRRPGRGPGGQPRAQAMFDILTSQNRFAILYRLNVHPARHPGPAHPDFVAMLARGRPSIPRRPTGNPSGAGRTGGGAVAESVAAA